MASVWTPPPSPFGFAHSSFLFVFMSLLLMLLSSSFQNSHAQTTEPSEVKALNSLFMTWNTSAKEASHGLWNTTGDPCTGSAVNATEFEDPDNNPAIKCDCSYENKTTCHITQLRVYALNKHGIIPEDITGLPYLTLLKIDQNFFSGPLPAFIANLTKLQQLSVAINSFSGPIPKELGSLTDLNLLSFGLNNFSGTLPPELGNLVKLEQIYINSCGLGGEIPPSFSNLIKMQTLWASDNPFTGRIPDFIGNWTALKTLRIQGNSFQGPIPSTFSNLVSLESLRISELSNGSSSLSFIENLKNLTDLTLRNAMISDTIPSHIAELPSLITLDLSFNNLTGQIPGALFNMSTLKYLFLGNNSLSGSLPLQKADTLQFIDLSYNQLSGTFPSWVRSDLRLNLVANNFGFDSQNISIFPGLNCLQRNFPCNKGAPRYAKFAIKCGGQEIRTNDGVVYEAENKTGDVVSYNVTNTEKWAVSNVGIFADNSQTTYVQNTLVQVSRTDTPELFQTARLSAGSLRYYGLGLENGVYIVNLEFAETAFDDTSKKTWQSLGRRMFDIYVQGRLEIKDFDITKQAGGVERATQKTFYASVTDNYLEIHLFWAGKGTCCIPKEGYYGPSISALSVVSNFTPTVPGIPPGLPGNRNRTGLIAGVTVAVGLACLFSVIAIVLYIKLKGSGIDEDQDLLGIGPTFSYSELKNATQDFNESHKLGEGGFGPVYKGLLLDGRPVAVKQLSVASHQGKSQFIAEIATISAVQHRNLVKLYGCCIEGNRRLLVYEYLENRSLDQALFEEKGLHLDWHTRFNICVGTAKGLAYLHEESRPRIVHRDVKASNILLDAELCPKISDFGLAKLYDDKKTHISTRVAGTIGYLAPEYAMRGHLTEKADVFGFGVVALEILSGRSNTDNSLESGKIYLLEWAWTLYERNEILELVDSSLKTYDEIEARRLMGVAFLCTQAVPNMRPSMSRVAAMLSGDVEVTPVTMKPSYITDWSFEDITKSFANEDETSSATASNRLSTSQSNNKSGSSAEVTQAPSGLPSPINLHELIGRGR